MTAERPPAAVRRRASAAPIRRGGCLTSLISTISPLPEFILAGVISDFRDLLDGPHFSCARSGSASGPDRPIVRSIVRQEGTTDPNARPICGTVRTRNDPGRENPGSVLVRASALSGAGSIHVFSFPTSPQRCRPFAALSVRRTAFARKNVQVSASAPIRLLRFYFRFRLAGTVRVAAPGARARPPCGRVPQTAGSLLTAARLRTAFAAAVKSISGALRRAHGGEDPASAGRIPILRRGGKICRNGRENDVARGLRPHAQAGKRPKPFVRRAETDETPIRSRNKSRSARIVRCARRGPSEAIGTHFFLPQPAFSSGETTGKASYLLKRRENRKAYEKNYPFRGRGLVRLHDRIGPREGKKS